MNVSILKTARVAALLSVGLAGVLAFAEGDTVLSPARRQDALDKGKKLIAPRESVPVASDPFHPAAFAELLSEMGRGPSTAAATPEQPSAPTGPRGDREVLQALAQSLKPSGYIELGGQPSLSFGQKRVKPGGFLTINFEGTEYTLEITAIDRTTFTLRLNREEFTRTIK